MSYDLIAIGVGDYEDLHAELPPRDHFEVFPIPPEAPGDLPGLGIALPRSRSEGAYLELVALIRILWRRGATVIDLYRGERVANVADLAATREEIES
jgi:hypothetical protein